MLPITVTTKDQGANCPVRNVLAQVTGKWVMLIVLSLEDGPLRFAQVKRAVGDVTQRVLTENLRKLERDGYLTRSVIPGPPVEVHYALTARGQVLTGHFRTLVHWAAGEFAQVQQSRADYDART